MNQYNNETAFGGCFNEFYTPFRFISMERSTYIKMLADHLLVFFVSSMTCHESGFQNKQ